MIPQNASRCLSHRGSSRVAAGAYLITCQRQLLSNHMLVHTRQVGNTWLAAANVHALVLNPAWLVSYTCSTLPEAYPVSTAALSGVLRTVCTGVSRAVCCWVILLLDYTRCMCSEVTASCARQMTMGAIVCAAGNYTGGIVCNQQSHSRS